MNGDGPPDPPMRDFSRSLPMALLRAREAVMDRFRPSLRDFGITEQQWRVLRALHDRGEVETGALAGLCCLLTPSLSRILKHLESTGLVSRRPAPSDQRRTLVAISPDGRALLERRAPYSEAQYRAIEEAFGKERIDALYETLENLHNALEQEKS